MDIHGIPEKFLGQHLKHWQQCMKIWFTTMGFLSKLESICPTISHVDPENSEKIDAWKKVDYLYHRCILVGLSNILFDMYNGSTKMEKEHWDELDKKYNIKDLGSEKYSVAKILRYQMVEGKLVSDQTHAFLFMFHGLAETNMKLSYKFQVMATIEKFPKSWEDFGMLLKYRMEMISNVLYPLRIIERRNS